MEFFYDEPSSTVSYFTIVSGAAILTIVCAKAGADGLGIAVFGVSPSPGGLDIFGSSAHAQANNIVSSTVQRQGFADLVERVKPSVISVKVTMKERASDAANKSDDDGSGSPMERFFRQFGGPDGVPQNPGREGRHGEMSGAIAWRNSFS